MKRLREQIGSRIRVLRQNKALSQEALAYNSGLHRSHMGQVERGESNVTVTTLHKIGSALGVSLSDMLKGIGEGGHFADR
ncbi:MAG TPA: helix-turn-helix transcriptional regulator [Candidatus Angelobacter sp.]